MFTTIRRYQSKPGAVEQIAQRVKESFLPRIRQAPGFVGYYVLRADNDVVITVSVFESRAAAEQSSALASQWIRENPDVAALLPGPPEITTAEALFYEVR